MPVINMLEAKSNLSRLVQAVESGAEAEFIIARNGHPAARLVPLAKPSSTQRRIGVARGQFTAPDVQTAADDEAASLFITSA